MPTVAPIQTTLNCGEFSPLLYGRIDYAKYKSGTALTSGFVPLIQGGVTRRTGTKYVSSTKGDLEARLVRFVFSNGDAFVLEFGTTHIRFYRNRAPVETSPGVPYEIVNPYAIADVPFLRFQQSRDVIYISHPSYKPQKLIRSGLTSWAFSAITFLDGPYLAINNTTTTLTASATSGAAVTVTASSITGINGGTGFQTTDVGRLIRLKHSTTWGWAIITARASTTSITVNVQSNFGATTATTIWRLGEWSDTTLYPAYVFLFEDRLGWAASPVEPTTLNLSKTGDYENMAPTDASSVVAADNSLQIRINAKEQDPIRWVYDDEKGLIIGTKGGEYIVRASTTGEAMSAINFPSARRSTKYGSANVEPVEVGKSILFVQTAKRKVRQLAYVYEVDGFRASDLTVLAEHMTKGNVAQMVYQQEPFSIVWVRLEDGSLRGMTYDREQDVVGWHRHPIGGWYDSGKTIPAKVESIVSIPSPSGDQDDLWMIVARYVNGAVRRYVEYLSAFNADYDKVSDCYFVDGGKTIDLGAPGTSVTGLNHLEGQEVQLLVDGTPQPSKTVSGGAITLDNAGQVVHVGLGYKSQIKILRQEAGSANGTAQGKTKRTHKLSARFHQTVGVKVGNGFDGDLLSNGYTAEMTIVDFGPNIANMNNAVPLFSGDKALDLADDYSTEGYLCFEQDQPLPCTMLAIMPQLTTQDAL